MEKIVANIWLMIIAYTGYSVWEAFNLHTEKVEIARNQIPEIQSNIAKMQKEKKQLENYFSDIEEAKARIEKVAAEIEKLQQQFPSEISDTDNLALISSIAEILNVKNIFLQPGSEENKGFFYAKLYNIKASGTFLQFLIFLEKISEAKRLMNIHSIKLSHMEKAQKGRFQLINADINIEVYRYNPNFREKRGIEDIEKQFEAGKAAPRSRRKKRQ